MKKGMPESGIPDGRMVRPARVERATYSSGGCRSIQLSHGRKGKVPGVKGTMHRNRHIVNVFYCGALGL